VTFPLFPQQTEWVPPSTFPDLSTAKEIAIDLETCDPNLERCGPGWPRADGYVVGYAFAVDGWSGYYPVRHQGGGNLDQGLVERFVRRVLELPCDKVMHNAAYDVGWLLASGFKVHGRIIDTMIAAPLIDENRFSFSLNALGFEYLKEIKSEQGLKDAAADFGVHPKKELWKLPAMHVGEYAEQDAMLTLKLWQHFKTVLRKEEVEHIFNLETELLPVLIDLTYKGIRFDRDRASSLIQEMTEKEAHLLAEIEKIGGSKIDMWAAASIAVVFDRLKIEYPRSATGLPSFTRTFLDTHSHPVAKLIVEARELNKTAGTFLQPYLDFSAKDGRIHTHFNQMRNDEGGTVTGRLSASNPNLQQVPARHEIIGPMVRSLFLPEEGELWAACDFSSQEPRLLVHYAALLDLPGAEKMAQAYREDPNTDFHQMVADMAGLNRKAAKTIGLGLCYGMGKAKLAQQLDLPVEEASELIATFHEKVPFLKGTINAVMNRINRPASGGAIRTLLGRKCRFPLWEPTEWGVNKALPYEQAIVDYGPRIKRAMTYKGLNRLIQGSAADQTKAAMVALHKAGFNLLLQVHDEIALSVKNEKQAQEAAEIMRTAVKLEVPSLVDVELGPSWGKAI
jgi:DNA polymerase I-like protein with 3'-5' exonuclease and polymerase domains